MTAQTYEDLLRKVFELGVPKGDRTGTGTVSLFGGEIGYNLADGFPLITSKHVPFRIVAEELLWFLSGESNIQPLVAKKVRIWSEWAFKPYLIKTEQPVPEVNSPEWKEQLEKFEQCIRQDDEFAYQHGDLGPVYGVQWRKFPTRDGKTVDQIANIVNLLKTNPNSRRMVVSAWNPGDLADMALEPCHVMFQFYVVNGKLSCKITQRSADMFLGVPFNLASYALLTHMLAEQCGLEVGELIWSGGDIHIYNNHREQVHQLLSRTPLPLPTLVLNDKPDSIDEYTIDNFEVVGYQHGGRISAPVAV